MPDQPDQQQSPLGFPVRMGFAVMALSVLANGAGLHAMKPALQHGSPATIAALSSAFTCGLLLLWGAVWRTMGWTLGNFQQLTARALIHWLSQRYTLVLLGGGLAGASSVLTQVTIHRWGPETAAFLSKQTLIFLVLGGLLLGERIRKSELLVIVVIFVGALLFSYQDGQLHWLAVAVMALACMGMSGKQIIVRQSANRDSLPVVMAGMQLGAAVSAGLVGLVTGSLYVPAVPAFGWTLLGSTLTGVVGMSLLYAGYGMIGISRGAPIDAMRPLVVLLLGLALGAPWPGHVQLAGAACSLAGALALTYLHQPRQPTRQPQPAEPVSVEPVQPERPAAG